MVTAATRKQIYEWFGVDRLRKGQDPIITDILAGNDVIAMMPVGYGKSLCYQAPVALGNFVVVVSPLISLMNDQIRQLQDQGIHAVTVNSTQTKRDKEQNLEAIAECDIFYVSPETLTRSHVQHPLAQRGVDHVAIDEVHCISTWGHDFRPDYLRLRDSIEAIGSPPVCGFTATATPRVLEDVVATLQIPNCHIHRGKILRPNLTFSVENIPPEDRIAYVQKLLKQKRRRPAIVYFPSIAKLDRVSHTLKETLSAVEYHSQLQKETRRTNERSFLAGESDVMLATSAFGMGINKPDVRTIIHYGLPTSLEGYYQEAGRAGRDGRRAQCVLLYDQRDFMTLEWFAQTNNPPYEFVERMYRFCKSWKGKGKVTGLGLFSKAPNKHAQMRKSAMANAAFAFLQDMGYVDHVDGVIVLGDNDLPLESYQKLLDARLEQAHALIHTMGCYARTPQGHAERIEHYFKTGSVEYEYARE